MSRLEKLRQNREETPLVYSRTEKEKEPRSSNWLQILIIIILFSALVYLIFFSHLFDVKHIEVTGYKNPDKVVQAAEEQGSAWWLANNIILFNKNNVIEALSGDPLISDIYIRKIFPNKILIEVAESKPSLIWSTKGENYVVDERGAVLGPAGNNDKKLPQVFDSADIEVERGDKVASPTFIKFIQGIWEGFEDATDTKISKIIIFDLINDVHVLSSAGWTVYLDASKDHSSELKDLTKVLAEAKKATARLEYIDLRLDTKAFYK